MPSRKKSKTKSHIKSQVKSRVKSHVKSRVKSRVESHVKSHVKSQVKSHAKSHAKSRTKSRVDSRRKFFGILKNVINTKNKFVKSQVVNLIQMLESSFGLSSFRVLSLLANAMPENLYAIFINSLMSFLLYNVETVSGVTESVQSILFDLITFYKFQYKSNIKTALKRISGIFTVMYMIIGFFMKHNIKPNLLQNVLEYIFSIVLSIVKRVVFAGVEIPNSFLRNILLAPFEDMLFTKSLDIIQKVFNLKKDQDQIKDPDTVEKISTYLNSIKLSVENTVDKYLPLGVKTAGKMLISTIV